MVCVPWSNSFTLRLKVACFLTRPHDHYHSSGFCPLPHSKTLVSKKNLCDKSFFLTETDFFVLFALLPCRRLRNQTLCNRGRKAERNAELLEAAKRVINELDERVS